MLGEHGVVENFKLAQESGANILDQKPDGSCIYLEGNQCSIHSNRPSVCRDFFCTSKAERFTGMVKIIKQKDPEKISSVSQIKS